MNDLEIWKPIIGYEGLYEVSNYGRIKSLPKKGYSVTDPTIRSLYPNENGYMVVILSKDGHRKTFKVHRLVIECFLYPSKLQVDHIDGNRSNNRISNLRYCTHYENKMFKKRLEGCASKYIGVSIDRGKWKAKIRINGKNKHLGMFKTEEEAANAYSIARSQKLADGN